MSRQIARAAWALVITLSVATALVSYRYLAPHPPGAPAGVAANPMAAWLPVHAAGAATALLLGGFQFVPGLRRRRRLHRWIGRTYVIGCLLGGLAGLLLAFGTTAGPIAAAGFASLGGLWLCATAQGWRLARAERFEAHRRWMIRSFALAAAAVTLRLYLPLSALAHLEFSSAYRAIAWLCWAPNLLLAELYLARGRAASVAGAPA